MSTTRFLILLFAVAGTFAASGCGPIGAPNCQNLPHLKFEDGEYLRDGAPVLEEAFPQMAGSTRQVVGVDLENSVVIVQYRDAEDRRVREIWEMQDIETIQSR